VQILELAEESGRGGCVWLRGSLVLWSVLDYAVERESISYEDSLGKIYVIRSVE
jgi:hypothetical protein